MMLQGIKSTFLGRLLIALKIMWCYFALYAAAEISEGLFHTLIAFIALSVPAWAHSGIKWVFAMEIMPLWTIGLFLLIAASALLPVITNDYSYIFEDYLPLGMVLMPAVFCIFFYLQNRQYLQRSLMLDLLQAARFIKRKIMGLPKAAKNSFYVALIIFLAGVAVNNLVEAYRPEEYRMTDEDLDKFYGSVIGQGHTFSHSIVKNSGIKTPTSVNKKWYALPYWERLHLSLENWRAQQ